MMVYGLRVKWKDKGSILGKMGPSTLENSTMACRMGMATLSQHRELKNGEDGR